MPGWWQDLAALTTVSLAAVWLVLRWVRIGQPQAQPGCARCDHNPLVSAAPSTQAQARKGVRSNQLRVLG